MRISWLLVSCALAIAAPGGAQAGPRKPVVLSFVPGDVQARYAAQQVRSALEKEQYAVLDVRSPAAFRIVLTRASSGLGPEAFKITRARDELTITAGGGRGLIYGAFAVAEQLASGRDIKHVRPLAERPLVAFRAIKFDLPWDSYRASAALDQHRPTVRDVRFWAAFLDMMARNRFNAITLSNLHPWPYMVRTSGFPAANPFDDDELAQWQQLHRTIFRLAKERGIDTYLLPFNIFVNKEFAAAYGAGAGNTYPRYNVKGDASPIIRSYVRASIAQVLADYPDLTGLGINLGEGMGDMSPDERVGYIRDTYLAAIREARRPVKLMWNISSVETKEWKRGSDDPLADERHLRAAIESVDHVDGPIMANLKFNWSHALSTPKLVQIHGGKVGDTYFAPLPRNYRISWIARNEDVFALRWGVPAFVREHVRRNGKPPYVGGYTVGSETYIPALDYFTVAPEHPQWTYAFERQWLFYMLWGRLLYNPATSDQVFADAFAQRYGPKGRNLLQAYGLASSTALRLASLFYSQWDHTLYSEGMMWLGGRTMAYIGVEALLKQKVLDPDYISVPDYVEAKQQGRSFAPSQVTPLALADRLDADCTAALRLVEKLDAGSDQALDQEIADVRAWAHLGRHLAAKLRGAVALHTYRTSGAPEMKARAVGHLQNALAEWDAVIAITTPRYKPMLLTHFTGQSSALNPDAEFHWSKLRADVARDVDLARAAEPAGRPR